MMKRYGIIIGEKQTRSQKESELRFSPYVGYAEKRLSRKQ